MKPYVDSLTITHCQLLRYTLCVMRYALCQQNPLFAKEFTEANCLTRHPVLRKMLCVYFVMFHKLPRFKLATSVWSSYPCSSLPALRIDIACWFSVECFLGIRFATLSEQEVFFVRRLNLEFLCFSFRLFIFILF